MRRDLEAPRGSPERWAEQLYRARREEIPLHRPIFTGDAFEDVPIRTSGGSIDRRAVMVLQHPCAMRTDGVNLAARVLVCEIHQHKALTPQDWLGYAKLMSLPDFYASGSSRKRNCAAMFDRLEVIDSAELDPARRLVCLTRPGVNLLLQRRVHYDTRVVVPTGDLNVVTGGVYEEADILEDWCGAAVAAGVGQTEATEECLRWLREDLGDGLTRQRLLEEEQNRSGMRRKALKWAKEHYV